MFCKLKTFFGLWLALSLAAIPVSSFVAWFASLKVGKQHWLDMALATQALLMFITLVRAWEHLRSKQKVILLARRPARALNRVWAFSFLTFDKTTLIL